MQKQQQHSWFDGDALDDASDELATIADTYNAYQPRHLHIGRAHPDTVVESASLARYDSFQLD